MRTRTPVVLAAVFLACGAAALHAQQDTTRKDTTAQPVAPMPVAPAPDTQAAAQPAASPEGVRPGMSEADVRQMWGAPVAVRRRGDWTYLFYRNGQERHLGYYDTVFLQNGMVVDAVVRGEGHMYLGTSSSPEGRVPEFTPPANPPAQQPAEVGGVQVNPPAQPAPSRPED